MVKKTRLRFDDGAQGLKLMTCWGVSTPRSGLGLRMVKELDLQLVLGMNERR